LPLPIAAAAFYLAGTANGDEGLSEAVQESGGGKAGAGFRIAMAAGLLLTLAANAPGQLSYDSVVSLIEARTGIRQTWAPAISSAILKPFDHLVAGTGLYVTASAALLFLSLMSLTRLRPRSTWAAVGLGVLAILTPQLLIYQGIVWRDVLFANMTIAGFLLLAQAARTWPSRPILPLAGALVCLAVAALARQNGLIVVVAAAGVLAWTARAAGWRASLAWGLGGLAAVGVLALAVNRLATPVKTVKNQRGDAGMLILEHYDIIGAKAHMPKLRLKEIAKVNPGAAAYLEANSARFYSAARIDTIDRDPALGKALWGVPTPVMHAQWRRIVLHYPAAYVLQRADVFRWTLLTPDLPQCLPVTVGVIGPPAALPDLEMQTGIDPQDQGVLNYAMRFYRTPVFSHLAWALAALAVMGLLLRRRDPVDWVIVTLLGAALVFAASFAVISVACDYRYLYPLDLAAIVGVLYWALDPPRWCKVPEPAA
jgi:hypothetical protein